VDAGTFLWPMGREYPSLWVTRGGEYFNNIWSPNTFAQAGSHL
jgi:hypothetical protein